MEEKIALFQQYASMIRKAKEEGKDNVITLHGMVHVFYGALDVAIQILQDMVYHTGGEVSFMTPVRELIMEAYELYAFIDDEVWMDMVEERDDRRFKEEDLEGKVERICTIYMPALSLVVEKALQGDAIMDV